MVVLGEGVEQIVMSRPESCNKSRISFAFCMTGGCSSLACLLPVHHAELKWSSYERSGEGLEDGRGERGKGRERDGEGGREREREREGEKERD